MRLIDWDNVLEWMHRQKETMEQWSMRIAIENYVDEMPTIDAVPVVRCKDCKYCSVNRYADGNVYGYVCIEMDYGVNADDFCSRGKRRDEDETHN